VSADPSGPSGPRVVRRPVRGVIPWRTIELTLLSTRSAWLSTTRPDGRPHAAPVWFVWDDGVVYFATGTGSQKGRNLAEQPFAVLQVGDGDDVVIVEGTVRLVSDDDERRRVDDDYAAKYVEPVTGEQATTGLVGDGLYGLEVERVMAWIYGNVGARTDWRWTRSRPSG
jgi:PPOX class probable F420-dependent enzyme